MFSGGIEMEHWLEKGKHIAHVHIKKGLVLILEETHLIFDHDLITRIIIY